MRGPHSQSHATLQYRGHVRDKKCYISTFTRQDADLGWVNLTCKVTWHINHVVIWQMKNVLSPLSQGLWTPNLAGWRLRMREPHLQNHVTHWPLGHATNQKCYISTFTRPMKPKHSRVVTEDEGTSPTMSCDISILWSRYKWKTFYLHFHKAYGPQT